MMHADSSALLLLSVRDVVRHRRLSRNELESTSRIFDRLQRSGRSINWSIANSGSDSTREGGNFAICLQLEQFIEQIKLDCFAMNLNSYNTFLCACKRRRSVLDCRWVQCERENDDKEKYCVFGTRFSSVGNDECKMDKNSRKMRISAGYLIFVSFQIKCNFI